MGGIFTKGAGSATAEQLLAKDSVRLATTTNVGLSGLSNIDGVAPVGGDRILVKNQSTDSQNGIYVAASGAWTRATDFDEDSDIQPNILVGVSEGTLNADTFWQLTTDAPIILDTTPLTFEKVIPQIVTTNNMVYVSKNGNDSTGQRHRLDLPFLTIGAAIAAASNGDTVYVFAGIYNEKNLLKNGVNIYLDVNAEIRYSGSGNGSIFDDGANGANGTVTAVISGAGGSIITNGGTGTVNGVVNIVNDSNISIWNCDISCSSGAAAITVNNANATLNIRSCDITQTSNGLLLVNSNSTSTKIQGCTMTGNDTVDLVTISGGVTHLTNTRIVNISIDPTIPALIDLTGGASLTLDGVQLVKTGAGGFSIEDSSGLGQTITVYSGVADRQVDSAYITQSVSTLIIDNNVI